MLEASSVIRKKEAVYTAYVAPSRPKKQLVTDGRTEGPTIRPTDTPSCRVATKDQSCMRYTSKKGKMEAPVNILNELHAYLFIANTT